ncbi:unnamed protein product [Dracunculus medinensis]|uniref:N-acetyltransferase domain-containing protein n=1 Tax=Dracunculus medinensis TaxID=318479 RepID=A0A0N4UNR8_DRAME|nr:unnamed protein product [Dracunculus medinensis]
MSTLKSLVIQRIEPKHARNLIVMTKEEAEFQKMLDQVTNTEEKLRSDIRRGDVDGFIAFDGEEPIGMVLFGYSYSTWVNQIINVESIYVREKYRRFHIGKKLWMEAVKVAKERGIARMQWICLNWNTNAMEFYEKMHARNLSAEEGWLLYKLGSQEIDKLVADHKLIN